MTRVHVSEAIAVKLFWMFSIPLSFSWWLIIKTTLGKKPFSLTQNIRCWFLGSHNAKIALGRTALFVTVKSRWPSPSNFWAHLCILHGGLICIAFCLSVCLSHLIKINISKSIVARSMKLYHSIKSLGASRKNTDYTLKKNVSSQQVNLSVCLSVCLSVTLDKY